MEGTTEKEIKIIFPDTQTAFKKIRAVAKYVRTTYVRDVIYGLKTQDDKKKIRLRLEDNFENVSIDSTHKYKVGIEEGIKKEIEETLYKGNSFDDVVAIIQSQGDFAEENSYEKFRVLFADQNGTEITLDVYPRISSEGNNSFRARARTENGY